MVILDGATGSMLEGRGAPVDPVCWSALAALTHPDVLAEIHSEHIAAGAEVITTHTFATNRFVLAAVGRDADFERVNRAAVDAAKRARDSAGRPVRIAGSISCLAPAWDVSRYPDATEERASYDELAVMLAELGVDVLALEMMQDLTHAPRAVEAAQATGLPVWVGLSCRFDRVTGELAGHDFPGTRFADVAVALARLVPEAICVMHTPVGAVPAALEQLRSVWNGPVGVYPELGSYDPVSDTHSAAISPEAFGELGLGWHRDGVGILGGCCGALPAHIAALTRALGQP